LSLLVDIVLIELIIELRIKNGDGETSLRYYAMRIPIKMVTTFLFFCLNKKYSLSLVPPLSATNPTTQTKNSTHQMM